MAYIKLVLVDNETTIDKELLDHMQDGIVAAHNAVRVQPDWNQNDESAAGYIRNRPFYDASVVTILPETTVPLPEDTMYMASVPVPDGFSLKVGEMYIIKWNGVEYECVGTASQAEVVSLTTPVGEIDFLRPGSIWVSGYEEDIAAKISIAHKTSGGIVVQPEYVEAIKNAMPFEEWTFELEDGTTVTKRVMVR